jgi:hypothetical protein
MKLPAKVWLTASLAILLVLTSRCAYQHSRAYLLGAPEDRYRLWIAALKGLDGRVRYMGSDDDYSYFLVGDVFCSRYKAPTAKLHLPNTFRLGEGTPYDVSVEMVPQYP